MNIRTTLIASSLIAASFVSGAAQAALQGRDLDGNVATFEAYYDTVLNITWLADANYGAGSSYDDKDAYSGSTTDGRMTWENANAWAANLSFTDGVNVYDNWRLPIVGPVNGVSFSYNATYTETHDGSTDIGTNITSPNNEMAYMFYVNLGNPSYRTPTGALSGCSDNWPDNCLDSTGPFSNLQPDVYWSGTEFPPISGLEWVFFMHDGSQSADDKNYYRHSWAVSPGDVGAVPEAQTYALMLAGLGLIGWRARRRG